LSAIAVAAGTWPLAALHGGLASATVVRSTQRPDSAAQVINVSA